MENKKLIEIFEKKISDKISALIPCYLSAICVAESVSSAQSAFKLFFYELLQSSIIIYQNSIKHADAHLIEIPGLHQLTTIDQRLTTSD